MTLFFLATKIFFREIKSGQMIIMLLSLTVAIGILSSIALFSDRLQKSLDAESKNFLEEILNLRQAMKLKNLSFQKSTLILQKSISLVLF